jgi:HAD superfamily hydrolase (TIGR01509 family)
LDAIGIKDAFRAILTADDNIKPKPAPDSFIAAARIINIHPHLCQVFEDGEVGLEAARRAGMLATDVGLLP